MPLTTTHLLMTLRYFGYFDYPLSETELLWYCGASGEEHTLRLLLSQLVESGQISEYSNYYSLESAAEKLLKRKEGEARYAALQHRIMKTCKRLRYFPFIEFVGLSGSLAKGYASETADIDLFIVTRENRLWICRTLLHLFKKLSFLKHSQHWYCMNYFVDEKALLIEEQNYFTAIELATLKPLLDKNGVYHRLLSENQNWIIRELPNFPLNRPKRQPLFGTKLRNTVTGKIAELFSSDRLNSILMRWTDMRWRAKWKKHQFPDADYNLAFKTTIRVSKNHRHNYQKKLLRTLEEGFQVKIEE